MKVKMMVELDYDETIMHHEDADGIEWFYGKILYRTEGKLLLHSNEICGTVGKVRVICAVNPYNNSLKQPEQAGRFESE